MQMALAMILFLFLGNWLYAQKMSFFAEEIAPILAAKCVSCHAGNVKMGGLVLDTFDGLEAGGNHGKIIVPGKSEESCLYLILNGEIEPRMPLSEEVLPRQEMALIKKWIDDGAVPPRAEEIVSIISVDAQRIEKNESTTLVNSQIFSLSYSPDSKTLALGGFQNVKLVDPASGKTLTTLTGLAQITRSVAFSRDGSLLAAGGGPPARKGEIKIWEIESGQLLQTIEGHDDAIYAVAFSPGKKVLATSSYDQLIKFWDVDSGQELRTLTGHIDAVYTLAFTSDGSRLISGSADRSVKIWDPATGKRLFSLRDPLGGINSIALHPSGKLVAAGGVDRTIRVWELGKDSGKLIESLIAHQASILRLAYSPDGKTLISASADNTIKVFQAATLSEIWTITNQPDWVMSLEFSPDGSGFAAGRFDGSLSIYETTDYKERLKLLSVAR